MPTVIVTVVLVYAVASFIHVRDMWVAQALIILAILSFCALCVTSYLFVCSLISDASDDMNAALDNGMKKSVIAWFFISLAIGTIAAFAFMQCGIPVQHSLTAGLITFLIFAFTPTLARRRQNKGMEKAKEENEEPKLPESTDAEADSSEADTDKGDKSELPANYPEELNRYAIRVLFKELKEAQVVDENYRPINMTNTQMALLADAISTIFSIHNKWQVFEPFWRQKNMKQTLAQALRNDTQLSASIYQAFEKALSDPRVGAIKAFASWTERYSRKYLQ